MMSHLYNSILGFLSYPFQFTVRCHTVMQRSIVWATGSVSLPVTAASTGEICSSVDLNKALMSAMVHTTATTACPSQRHATYPLARHVTGLRHQMGPRVALWPVPDSGGETTMSTSHEYTVRLVAAVVQSMDSAGMYLPEGTEENHGTNLG